MLRVSENPSTGSKLRIPVITGPTGVGKTDLSLRIAEFVGGEIISVDSRQIFRELSIGTAKPGPSELARVPHHFIDERSLDEPYSAGRFAAEAWRRIEEIHARGGVPIAVGGSTLYLAALQRGMGAIPDVPPEVRESVMQRLDRVGAAALFSELERVDPVSASRMDPTKSQRLVRALEVYEATGVPLSEHQEVHTQSPFEYRTIVLNRERPELYARINARTRKMLKNGLLDEVRAVLDAGYDPSLNALRTIGYREAIAHLSGRIDYEEMASLIARNTRRYAKRQLTWFRRFPEYVWADADDREEVLIEALFS